MKVKRILTIVAFLFFMFPVCLKAQNQSTGGTEFWVTFIENYTQDTVNAENETILTITSVENAQVEVSIPATGWLQNFNVVKGVPTIVYLPRDNVTADIPEQKQNRGVRIYSDNEIVVVASNQRPASSDAALVFPVPALSEEYIVLSYGEYHPSAVDLMASSFVIIASENNTQVRITPSALTSGGKQAGIPFTKILQKGETFLVRSADGREDLSGSRIQVIQSGNGTIPKPLAVFAGAQCSYVGACPACDALYEQVWPRKRLGREYEFVPFKTRKGDLVRILSMEPATRVMLGATVFELDSGAWIDTVLSNPLTIAADKPIQVAQLSRGAACDTLVKTDADPFFLLLSPNEQMPRMPGGTFFFDANSATDKITDYYLNIITRKDDTAFVKLDDQPVPNGDPSELPFSLQPFRIISDNPDYAYARVKVSPGIHKLESTRGLVAYIYGYGYYESYGYIAASLLQDLTFDFSFAIQCDSTHFTSVIPAYYTGSVTCSWDFGDGTTSTAINPVHTWSYADTFKVQLIVSTLSFSDTIIKDVIIAAYILEAEAGNDTLICRGDTVTLNGSTSGANRIRWSPSEGLSDTTIANPVASPLSSKKYYLTAIDTICNKTIRDSIEVLVAEPLDTPQVYCDTSGNSIFFYWNKIPGAEGYYLKLDSGQVWYDTLASAMDTAYVVEPVLVSTKISMEVIPASLLPCGDGTASPPVFCEIVLPEDSEDTILVPAEPVLNPVNACYLYIPSAFTPNGDGVNDIFQPATACPYRLTIFNRWGERVFQENNKGWNGTYDKLPVSPGIYVYVIMGSEEDAGKRHIGTLTLTR